MATIHINKGHNLKLAGSPKKEVKSLSCPKKIKIIPDNFPGVKPKMQITTNDQVKIGSKLFFDIVDVISMIFGPFLAMKF